MQKPKKPTRKPRAPEIGGTMAVALVRTMLAKGLLTSADVIEMVEEMDRVADAAQAQRPGGADATRRGAAAYRHALGNNPGVVFPLVLTAG